MYSVIVSFGVIVSLCFSVFIAKGIFGVYATLRQHNKMIKLKPNKRPLFFPFSDIHNIRYFVCLGVATFWPRGTRTHGLEMDFLRLACTCEETCESVWPPNENLYASSTCGYLRLLESV